MVPNANARHFRLKAAQRDLIAACGGIVRAAAICGYSKTEVGRWNNPDSPDIIALPAVDALQAECGRDFVLEALAENWGRKLVDEKLEPSIIECMLAKFSDVLQKAGEFSQSSAMAFADGKVTVTEAVDIDKHASELIDALHAMRKSTANARGAGGISLVRDAS